MATPGDPNRPDSEKTIGELVLEVTEQTAVLVREEIELAKAEVSEKLSTLGKSSAVAVAAGVFAFLAVILLMQAFALGLNSLFFEDEPWAGYLIEGILFIVIAVGAGLFAKKTFAETGPPVPTEAIEEAQEIQAILLPGEEEA
ncbi:MAG: phage holin family protein [Solirubrobacterales bacterium]